MSHEAFPTRKIRNWDKWQSYRRDRGQPPWIKVHREVMRNPQWVALSDAQRGQLVAIWLLAADRDGVIPASPDLLRKLCHMDATPNLEVFVAHGFMEPGVNVASPWRQGDQPETEAEAEAEAETDNPPVSPQGGKRRKPKKEIPEDWEPTDSHRLEARRLRIDMDREARKFRNHAEATGRLLVDWDAGFRNWLDKAAEYAPPDPQANRPELGLLRDAQIRP